MAAARPALQATRTVAPPKLTRRLRTRVGEEEAVTAWQLCNRCA